jgi:hypothetical protein
MKDRVDVVLIEIVFERWPLQASPATISARWSSPERNN